MFRRMMLALGDTIALQEYQWYRKYIGGHWELWSAAPGYMFWRNVPECRGPIFDRQVKGGYTPRYFLLHCETYP
jgi:hypothetical protein